MDPQLTRIPERLRDLLEATELEADVTIEGDEDGWTVTVELDHFEQFEAQEGQESQGRRLHVAVSGSGATPDDAAEGARQRLADVLESMPEPWSARRPSIQE